MMKVKDSNGNVLRGMYRAANGTIVVNDSTLLAKHEAEIASRIRDKQKIESLERTVEELSQLVKSLIGSKNDN